MQSDTAREPQSIEGEVAMGGTQAAVDGGGALGDDLLDRLDATLRRLRRALVRPPHTEVPVPSLGRPLELAKLFACDALADLCERAAQVSVKDVATAMHLEHSTVSRVLGELEADDLVQRSNDPADRRRTMVALSARGRAVVDDAHALRRSVTRTLLADWDAYDVATLATMLDRLADSVVERGEAMVAAMSAGPGDDPPPAPRVARPDRFTRRR